jgi:hypothetical protein
MATIVRFVLVLFLSDTVLALFFRITPSNQEPSSAASMQSFRILLPYHLLSTPKAPVQLLTPIPLTFILRLNTPLTIDLMEQTDLDMS